MLVLYLREPEFDKFVSHYTILVFHLYYAYIISGVKEDPIHNTFKEFQ
jgi:hypothetical protein